MHHIFSTIMKLWLSAKQATNDSFYLLFLYLNFLLHFLRGLTESQIWVGLGSGVSNLPMSSPGLPWTKKGVKKIESSGISPHKNPNHQTRVPLHALTTSQRHYLQIPSYWMLCI